MSHRNLLLLFIAAIVSYACYVRAEQNPYARYVAAGFSIIDRWALERPPDQELFNAAMRGMIRVLNAHGDEHSEFIDADRQAAFREDFEQEFGGVGVRLRLLGEPPLPTVVGLPEPGSPAALADIRLADRLHAVDGTSTAGMRLEDVTELIRGPTGTTVTLTLARPGEAQTRKVSLERAVVTVESVLGDLRDADGRWKYLISDEPRIGYVRVRIFGDKTAAELAAVLATLNKGDDKLAGLIIDLRDDAGGALDAAVRTCDLFLRAGQTIVTTRGRDGEVREAFLASGSGDSELPLVVIVDRNSASASEIVAACLQDYGRATIVGERSYGKGTVQRLMRLESGRSLLKITSATYWRPSEVNIHKMPGDGPEKDWGVTPDPEHRVPMTDAQYDAWRRYRLRRDLIGEAVDSEIVAALDLVDGKVPDDFVDRPLVHAIDAIKRLAAR